MTKVQVSISAGLWQTNLHKQPAYLERIWLKLLVMLVRVISADSHVRPHQEVCQEL